MGYEDLMASAVQALRDVKSNSFLPEDIVDANHDRTLSLLWKIFLGKDALGILAILDVTKLKEEIKHLERVFTFYPEISAVGSLNHIFSQSSQGLQLHDLH